MKIQYYIILSMILILSSCSDEGKIPDYGCMDEVSSNYNPDANIDDGSCEYIDCNLDLTGCEVCSPTYPTYVYNDIENMFIVNNCFLCHNGSSNTGLDLSTYQGLMNGGSNGFIITECNPDESLLITAFDIGGAMCNNNFSFCGLWDNSENLEMIQTWISEGTPE